MHKGFHAAGGLAPVEVLVRRMIPMFGQLGPMNKIGTFHAFCIVTTAPIEPPSRINAGSFPKPAFTDRFTAST